MAGTCEKSKNDAVKEQHERECFGQALKLSNRHGEQTKTILTYLNGTSFEGRPKNDNPDLVNICVKGKKNPTEIMVGIEHFEVNQLSKKSGDKIKSTGREFESKIWKAYGRGHEELLEKGVVSEECCRELSKQTMGLVQESFVREYSSLVQALGSAVCKHVSSADKYKENLAAISNGRSVEIAFLIEFRSAFPQFFYNDRHHVRKKEDGLIPITTDIVEILSGIDKSKVDYIILYMTNSSFGESEDVIAIRTGDIKKHLLAQGIKIYKYASEDFFEGKSSKFLPAKVESIDGKGLYQLIFRYEGLSGMEIKRELYPALRKAFYAKKKDIPFVASRSVQFALYALEKYISAFEQAGEYCQPVFTRHITPEYMDSKQKEFEETWGIGTGYE